MEVVMKNTNNNNNLLSKIATNNGHGENSPYFDGWKAYDANPFNLQRNPSGVIQMGLAENQLCFDLIQKWVEENSNASICTPQGSSDFKETAIFQDYHGLPEFRAAIANFMSMVRGNRVKFDPDRIVMSGGATGAHETVAFCLANPGEAFLVPTPYYPGFDRDLRWRTGVELVPVVCESSNNFKITREALETAYDNAILANIKVKGLLITNPSNPLGTFLDKDTLKDLVNFINQKNIHLVCDEIYAATVTSGDEFVSIAEVIKEEPTCNLDLIHIVYSLSKDMGFPGFRVGIVYSYNDKVVNIARKMSSFGLVSTQTQHMLASMLSDNKFVENFISESRVRLAHRHEMFTRGLSQVGIGSLESNAGLFIWMDLRRFLKEPTFESETTFWRIIINEIKLNVSPGQSFHCSEPGWFRVCFANMDDETTMIALRRIKKFVLKNKIEIKTKRMRILLLKLVLTLPVVSCIISGPFKLSFSNFSPFTEDSTFSPVQSLEWCALNACVNEDHVVEEETQVTIEEENCDYDEVGSVYDEEYFMIKRVTCVDSLLFNEKHLLVYSSKNMCTRIVDGGSCGYFGLHKRVSNLGMETIRLEAEFTEEWAFDTSFSIRILKALHGGGGDQGSLLPRSMRLYVPKFNGDDPESWIFAINEYFTLLATPDEQRLRVVGFNLEGDAAEWLR
ncbi:1-aminocyclopropane-1-carboxylate synthase-like protein [Tanacetum coccineum]|uniref:1-aminocyclopropane-1-carboxylate synthase-like protein n=1 Tax=Tanacetum coccineum TaxID=301880 RepID=A0ABQ5C8D8_9ASTR